VSRVALFFSVIAILKKKKEKKRKKCDDERVKSADTLEILFFSLEPKLFPSFSESFSTSSSLDAVWAHSTFLWAEAVLKKAIPFFIVCIWHRLYISDSNVAAEALRPDGCLDQAPGILMLELSGYRIRVERHACISCFRPGVFHIVFRAWSILLSIGTACILLVLHLFAPIHSVLWSCVKQSYRYYPFRKIPFILIFYTSLAIFCLWTQ